MVETIIDVVICIAAVIEAIISVLTFLKERKE